MVDASKWAILAYKQLGLKSVTVWLDKLASATAAKHAIRCSVIAAVRGPKAQLEGPVALKNSSRLAPVTSR